MQTVRSLIKNQYSEHYLPNPNQEVMRGVPWGRFEELFTPAYWASQVWMRRANYTKTAHRLGTTIQEEVAACLLGGHGIPAEVGIAAYNAIRAQGLLSRPGITQIQFERALEEPLCVKGRRVHYRFPRQKSRYLTCAMARLWSDAPQAQTDRAFRDWLLELPGIGLKTASWITRNWLDSDSVAIIDVHLYRAGLLAGFFRETDRVEKHYREMETSFIEFARAIGARTSVLDAIIWSDMKAIGKLVHDLISEHTQAKRFRADNHRPRQPGHRRRAA